MQEELKELKEKALVDISEASSLDKLKDVQVKYLGKKGELTKILRGMGNLSPEERPVVGKLANEIRDDLEQAFEERENNLKEAEMQKRWEEEKIDVTLPGRVISRGAKHPLKKVLDEVHDIFLGMGYNIEEGPEIETDYYNFEALNIPKGHPAREMQDSLYITEEILLRTHTSPVQIRTMEQVAPEIPVRIICTGKVYRKDDDATHSPMFHQIEGLVVGERITLGDLKGTLLNFAKQMFGPEVDIRLRPSYFPFTEPSAEVDISCVICEGSGCRVCKGTGWLEILGSGMVHPKVFEMSGYDPDKVTGFAFGMGVERIAMLKYGIQDLRIFFENDKRMVNQFK
ncbi:phenylalanine--tRNA ligase subunit alpha [Natranaerobius thermophilus]|uniref:Phenylalanine--tRNA ligase alpha subunit n=1 Tax=Natranaerobius thermophilus (strain ATCC BAA-1301 / DSM 18059 / JW/NM-WN-LF) TaxID=457570 RepID=SYFA_NATTJ|nr:phenylalanine--tRNA ligase subunit alpha [Natranaerobius thermophilus]B2A5N5.1 RecName: Full=Phenylalanine--tRNA ligase alpha subunit; AltName: Full=Phenylalanyl-tRNA synthetase alpha subunit; Short=PheRS [Natranaerobius thermophilus JW/NM-WN-LF]ACB85389.1 phenylalanyl-tRNA synthetase, alpha subunit [Natranaerobius thermophilus JW/NM-WN-LF]